MKKYSEKTKKIRCVYRTDCDICGKLVGSYDYKLGFSAIKITMESYVRTTYMTEQWTPADIEIVTVDLCYDCFHKKVLPLLKEKYDVTPTISNKKEYVFVGQITERWEVVE